MAAVRSAPEDSPRQRVERALARFERFCPSLRAFQVTVEVSGPRPAVVVLPAAGAPLGHVELVMTARGGMRTCLQPAGLGPAERRAVRELAWSLRDALTEPPEGRRAAQGPSR